MDPALATALAARAAGQTQHAVILFQALASQRPGDATILRLLGTSYAAADRLDLAAATLATAQALAPGDIDIALARGRVALWRNRRAEATSIANVIGAAEPGNIELPALRASIAAARFQNRQASFALTQSVSRVSLPGGKQTWTETAIATGAHIGRGASLTAEVERFKRGRLADTRGAARIDAVISPALRAYVGASATPKADFRERWAIRGGGEAKLGGLFTATLDARYAAYRSSGIIALEPGIQVATRDARLALALRSINLIDDAGDLRTGAGARIDLAASKRLRLFAGAARYSDAEAGIVRRVDSGFAGADVTLNDALTVRVTVDHDRRVASYRRNGLVVGLRWRSRP